MQGSIYDEISLQEEVLDLNAVSGFVISFADYVKMRGVDRWQAGISSAADASSPGQLLRQSLGSVGDYCCLFLEITP